MSRIVLPREEFLRPDHPMCPPGVTGRVRVDHDVNDAIQQGRGAWEGDPRYQLYANPKDQTWELWRLEHDQVYRMEGRQMQPGPGQTGQRLGDELLDTILTRLVLKDVRRGYDPVDELDAHEAAMDRQWDWDTSEIAGDFADRLKHALKKDGLLDHCTGA